MKSLFSFDQHKTKLNFQFLYDQLGPLLAFPPFGPTEFPLPLTLVVNYPKKEGFGLCYVWRPWLLSPESPMLNVKFGVKIPNQVENVLIHL